MAALHAMTFRCILPRAEKTVVRRHALAAEMNECAGRPGLLYQSSWSRESSRNAFVMAARVFEWCRDQATAQVFEIQDVSFVAKHRCRLTATISSVEIFHACSAVA